jgi:hypothetical protein
MLRTAEWEGSKQKWFGIVGSLIPRRRKDNPETQSALRNRSEKEASTPRARRTATKVTAVWCNRVKR